MKLLIQNNVVDKTSMVSLAMIAEAIGFEVLEFQNKGGLFYQGERPFVLPTKEKVFPFVSVATFKLIKDHENVLSYPLGDLNTSDFIRIFGEENMLNQTPEILEAEDIRWDGTEYFVRPYSTEKIFKGGIYVQPDPKIRGLCAVSPKKIIDSEYRFFVAHGEIIGKSQYIWRREYFLSSNVPCPVIEFAEEQIKKFQHVDYFVLDVATIDRQNKIVELNTFNTSGFYKIDFYAFLLKLKKVFNHG